MIPVRSVPAVRLAGATARAGGFTLVPLDLEVAAGSIHVVLGPNGAGKTTLLDLVVGLRVVDDGTVEVEGRLPDPDDAARYRRLGFAPDGDANLPVELTAGELWDLCARLHARIAGDAAAMSVRAAQVAARLRFAPPPFPLRAHSHGMRRKAQLVAALLHDPPVVVLDEPTNGLDPRSAGRARRRSSSSSRARPPPSPCWRPPTICSGPCASPTSSPSSPVARSSSRAPRRTSSPPTPWPRRRRRSTNSPKASADAGQRAQRPNLDPSGARSTGQGQ